MGPTANLGILEERKIPCSCWDSNPRFSSHFTDCAIMTNHSEYLFEFIIGGKKGRGVGGKQTLKSKHTQFSS